MSRIFHLLSENTQIHPVAELLQQADAGHAVAVFVQSTLKEVLGHENLDTTMIYTHVVDQNLKDAADANPLANLSPAPKKTPTEQDL